jgi:hypothetical protein
MYSNLYFFPSLVSRGLVHCALCVWYKITDRSAGLFLFLWWARLWEGKVRARRSRSLYKCTLQHNMFKRTKLMPAGNKHTPGRVFVGGAIRFFTRNIKGRDKRCRPWSIKKGALIKNTLACLPPLTRHRRKASGVVGVWMPRAPVPAQIEPVSSLALGPLFPSYIIITALTEQQPFAFPLLISELIKSDFSTLCSVRASQPASQREEMLKNLLN